MSRPASRRLSVPQHASALRLQVRGLVQGVGFRPFVWRLAHELGLSGWVRNDGGGVEIVAQGAPEALAALAARLRAEAPPLARVEAIDSHAVATIDRPAAGFVILDSAAGELSTAIGPDTAVCADCLAEMRRPGDRRFRYAFTTCTNCGPRYTIACRLPYDRAATSLAPFPLCAACAAEYGDPADRRFHAEATCCPACGPRLQLFAPERRPLAGDPLAAAAALVAGGGILALKGLGGFHLACDARNAAAVAALRQRKAREEKPFALMASDWRAIETLAVVDAAALALLRSRERPVVLLRKRAGADEAFPGVAPGLAWIGLMLPYTPLHHLLFDEAATTTPPGCPPVWVMTSANPGGEPLVIGNDEAFARLSGIADAFLVHDRAIVARCDDSVVRVAGCDDPLPRPTRDDDPPVDVAPGRGPAAAGERAPPLPAPAAGVPFQFIRRARGYTPQPIRLPAAGPATIAFGGGYKNTVCVTRGAEAFVSAHVGDLDNAAACAFLDETVERLLALTEIVPERVAADLHPDLYASRAAAAFAAARGLPMVPVQHHHAHVAAICAEHRIDGPVLGLALDGVGYGEEGDGRPGIWGGELLRVDGARCARLGHLAPLPLPGGDRAAREPWRMAAAALWQLGRGDEFARRFTGEAGAATVAAMLERGLNAPPTSSAGRLFDAAAGLLGISRRQSFEGQAAMALEGLAERHGPGEVLAAGWRIDGGMLDCRPLLASLVDEPDAARGAARFHATLAAALSDWLAGQAGQQRLTRVAAGGGCLLNRLLADGLRAGLARRGLTLIEAAAVPPGDGGLSLGQAWVAMRDDRY